MSGQPPTQGKSKLIGQSKIEDKLRDLQREFRKGANRFSAEVVLCIGHGDAFPGGFDDAPEKIDWAPDLNSGRITDSHLLLGELPDGPAELLMWFGDTASRDIFSTLAKRAMTLVKDYECPSGYEVVETEAPHFAWARWLCGQAEALNKPFEQCVVRWAKGFKSKGSWTEATSLSTEWKTKRSDIPKGRSVTAEIEEYMADRREFYTGSREKPTRVAPKHRQANRARKDFGVVIARLPVFDWSDDATNPTDLGSAEANQQRRC